MTFEQLQEKIGTQNKDDWKQHTNGKGWIHKNAKVDDSAFVAENSIVWGIVSGNASVSGNARVYGDAWVKPILFLLDSRGHGATNCKHGWLKIGCEEHSFADWQSRFEAIARRHNLNDEEKIEYKAIIDLFCKIGK